MKTTFSIYKTILTVILVCITLSALPQSSDINLLLNKLETAHSFEKIEILNSLSVEYRGNDRKTAMQYANDALFLATNFNHTESIALSQKNIGIIFLFTGELNKSLEFFKKSLANYEKINNIEGQANLSHNLGLVYKGLGNFDKSIIYYKKSLAIEESRNNEEGVASTLCNLANLHNYKGNYDTALILLKKSTAYYEKVKDEFSLMDNYLNIGDLYLGQGFIKKSFHYLGAALSLAERNNDNYTKAICLNELAMAHYSIENYNFSLDLLNESLILRGILNDKLGEGKCLINMGTIYTELEKYNKANELYLRALKIVEEADNKRSIANTYTSIGKNLLLKGLPHKAISYFEQSLEISREIGAKPETCDNYEQLIITYATIKDFDKSKLYMKAFSALDDNLRLKNIEDILIETIEKKKNPYFWMYIIAGLIAIIGIGITLFIRKK
ncbi:MAG: tetratricopeptide repeat protein [Bacteroidota bacterium]|nr:tetratricopeptide repeat protein [Bacteroidota bacterium]